MTKKVDMTTGAASVKQAKKNLETTKANIKGLEKSQGVVLDEMSKRLTEEKVPFEKGNAKSIKEAFEKTL